MKYKNDDDKYFEYSFSNILEDRYSKYAKYIIQERALPDGRDGLKPVQRRILYSMHCLKLNYNSNYKKSARIVGEVIGKYHPHGDTSVYEAMVRMSQDWKTNAPLIKFQGNNGSIDGDSAAAMRYTEVKLSKFSGWLLKDLNKEIINFIPNFDDSEEEPVVLPAPFPNLLVNGATGIAAGYATNIPPHNLNEVINALIYRIKKRNCTIDEILKIITGPDFPTGGIIENKPGIVQAYKTGKGMISLKSKIIIKDKVIQITEIPYEVNKKHLIQSIDELRIDPSNHINIKKVQDYSDKNGVSILIEISNEKEAEYIKNFLLKKTNLQVSYNFNMIAIIDKKPVQCNILQLLDCYLNHREYVILNKTKSELKEIDKKLNILDGFIKCTSIIDSVVRLIKKSSNKSDAINNLMKRYKFNFIQAEAIVLLRLYKLTSTDVSEAKSRLELLLKKQSYLRKLFSNVNLRNQYIIDELNEISKEFKIKRKSTIKNSIERIILDEREIQTDRQVLLTISKKGYIRLVYFNNKINTNLMKIKYGDFIVSRINTSNKNTLCLVTNLGNAFFINLNDIKASSSNEFGTHISSYVKISLDETVINSFIFDNSLNSQKCIALFSKKGYAKKIKLSNLTNKRKKIFSLFNLDDDEIINSFLVDDSVNNYIGITKNGYITKYNTDILKEYLKPKGKGSKFIKLKPDDELLYANKIYDTNQECLVITKQYKYKVMNFNEYNILKNVGIGYKIKNITNMKILTAFLVSKDTKLFSFKSDKTIDSSIFQKIYTSKRTKTFQKIPSENINTWVIEKYDEDLGNDINATNPNNNVKNDPNTAIEKKDL